MRSSARETPAGFCAALRLALVGALLAGAPLLRADRTEDLARIHLEALGGRERIDALAALRATGQVIDAEGRRVRFTMTAARPARVRLETGGGTRTLVQATDGKEPPWEFDTGKWPPRYQTMFENVGRTFATDAEFDDPLVAGAPRGYTADFTGETLVEGRKLLRVVVTRKPAEAFTLLLDAETYLIAIRVEKRSGSGGKTFQVQTRFDDYRPVDGVLLPHKVTIAVDGRVTQQTLIDNIEPNPALTPETFTRPKAPAPAPAETND
jgi:hypothetical protein